MVFTILYSRHLCLRVGCSTSLSIFKDFYSFNFGHSDGCMMLFQFAFSWKVVEQIFMWFLAIWTSVTYSNVLPIKKLWGRGFLSLICGNSLYIVDMRPSSDRYMDYKYFLQVYGLLFHFLHVVFWWSLVCFFLLWLFPFVPCLRNLPTLRLWRYSPMFSSRHFIVLARPVIDLDLTFVYILR